MAEPDPAMDALAEILAAFPGLVRPAAGRPAADIPAARWVARRLALADELQFVRLVEAFCKGVTHGR